MRITEFRQTGLLEILILLLKEDLKITDITKTVSQHSAYRSIYILLNLSLISERRGKYNKNYYCLTEKGKEVALLLQEIEKTLQSE